MSYETRQAKASGEYVLGTHDAELDRLGLQHRLWSEHTFALWARAGFKPGDHVLDLGAGPGFASFDMAELLGGSARVTAIDESPRFIEHLRRRADREGRGNLQAVVGDVQSLPFADAEFDACYTRWVLCFVPDPARAVREAARVLRPGGVFAVQDYFNYETLTVAPKTPIMQRVALAIGRAWRDRGGDPDIVSRLPRMMIDSGFDVLEIRPQLRVARPGEMLWQWPDTYFANFVPKLVDLGHITADELHQFMTEWRRAGSDPACFWFSPPLFEVIARKRA